jgi:hypothetical protein
MLRPTRRGLRRATLPVKGRDWSPTICASSDVLMQFRAFGSIHGADAAPSLPLAGRVASAAGRVGSDSGSPRILPPTATPMQFLTRSVIGGRGNRSKAMSNNDWKNTLPFKRHWAVYLLFKILVLAGAAFAAWQMLRSFEVV